MPARCDQDIKAKAIWLVGEHAGDLNCWRRTNGHIA